MTTLRAPRDTAPSHLLAPLLLAAGSLLCIAPARAQTAGCDQFKETLAARIRIGGFSLEAVPAATKLPPGTKVVGTCEGGAYKILLRRGAAAQQAAGDEPPAAAPAPVAKPAATPTSTPTRTPTPTATPAPTPTPTPTPVPTPAPTPVPTPQPTPPQAGDASVAPAVATAEAAGTGVASWTERVTGFLTRHWPWVLTLGGLPLLIWLAAWITHRRHFDEAGLPRGPRLN